MKTISQLFSAPIRHFEMADGRAFVLRLKTEVYQFESGRTDASYSVRIDWIDAEGTPVPVAYRHLDLDEVEVTLAVFTAVMDEAYREDATFSELHYAIGSLADAVIRACKWKYAHAHLA